MLTGEEKYVGGSPLQPLDEKSPLQPPPVGEALDSVAFRNFYFFKNWFNKQVDYLLFATVAIDSEISSATAYTKSPPPISLDREGLGL